MSDIEKRLTDAADDLNVLVWSEHRQAEQAQDALHAAVDEIERLRSLLRRLLAVEIPQGLLRNLDGFTADDAALIGELWEEGARS